MNIKIISLLIAMVIMVISSCLFGQQPSYNISSFNLSFEESLDKYYPIVKPQEAVYNVDLLQPQFVEGVAGRALDLSANATFRRPVQLDSLETPSYSGNALTASVWVKTLPGARQGTAIMGNKSLKELGKAGWVIYTQDNGAWGVNISDGESSSTFNPTAPRQAINDGKWHHLLFSLDNSKGEIWFYLDGRNVAIYNCSKFSDISSQSPTIVGGTDEYFEYGSYGQWTAFNGYLDEVNITDEFATRDSVSDEFSRYCSSECSDAKLSSTISGRDNIDPSQLKIMEWNIWHGGRRYGEHVGVARTIETIKSANPDIVALIETYGSGEIIADSLGYYYYLISSNLSIMSRYPITETIKAFRSFNFGGARVDLGNGEEIVVLDTWLHYLPDTGKNIIESKLSNKKLLQAEGETRYAEVVKILEEIEPICSASNKTPVVMLGDFNIGSHLDWIEATKAIHYNYVVEWPVSKAMERAGFIDSFRELHIDPLLDSGLTWTPRASTSSTEYGLRDRIDFIYYQGALKPIRSEVLDYHPIQFPSDHAALVTLFKRERTN